MPTLTPSVCLVEEGRLPTKHMPSTSMVSESKHLLPFLLPFLPFLLPSLGLSKSFYRSPVSHPFSDAADDDLEPVPQPEAHVHVVSTVPGRTGRTGQRSSEEP